MDLVAENKRLTELNATLLSEKESATQAKTKAEGDLTTANTTIGNLNAQVKTLQDEQASVIKERDQATKDLEASAAELLKLKGESKSASEQLVEQAAAAGVKATDKKVSGQEAGKKDWMKAYNDETDPTKAAAIYEEHIKPTLFGAGK